MKKGKEYIVFPLDVSSMDDAKRYVSLLRDHVGMFKIGLELFIRCGPGIIDIVRKTCDMGIFLDLKLHDISETVKRAMECVAGSGVELVSVHCASSTKMLEMAVKGGQGRTDILGVTVLTDNDAGVLAHCGFRDEYVQDTSLLVMKRAQMAYDAGCAGVVCSGHEVKQIKDRFGDGFMAVTPGIRPEWSRPANDDQKRITTPGMAVRAGADLIVVGRPIKTSADPVGAADAVAGEIDDALKLKTRHALSPYSNKYP